MRKIPTLFERDMTNRGQILPVYAVELPADAYATAKYDGTCVRLHRNGMWWARREVKPGKPRPAGFVALSTDPETGKTVGWIPLTNRPEHRWHWAAIVEYEDVRGGVAQPGTYEVVGPHFQSDPHGMGIDCLVAHGDKIVEPPPIAGLPPEGAMRVLRTYLDTLPYEGIVWWIYRPGIEDARPVAKIKRRDFHLPWPNR